VGQMKKSLIILMISFALSIGFTFISIFARASFSISMENNFVSNNLILNLISIFVSLAGLAMFFSVFYFLANNSKIQVMKSTVTAILLGTMLGPALFYFINIFLYQTLLGVYISLAASSAVSAIFQFFLPALTALMYVELREKQAINKMESSKPT
jgi:hypothetical protein